MAGNTTIKHDAFLDKPMGQKLADVLPGVGPVLLAFFKREFDIPENDDQIPQAQEVYAKFLEHLIEDGDQICVTVLDQQGNIAHRPLQCLQYGSLETERPKFIAWLGGNGRKHYDQHALKVYNCFVEYYQKYL